jgi:hypothetical protein
MKKVMRALPNTDQMLRAVVFALVAMSLVFVSVFVALQPPFTGLSWLSPIAEGVEVEFEANQGILLNPMSGESIALVPGDVIIMVPPGAIPGGGTLIAENHQPDILQEAGARGWSRPWILNLELLDSFGRSLTGVDLRQPIEICFVLPETYWQYYSLSPSSFEVQLYEEEKNPPKWQALPMIAYADEQRLCGQAFHLSLIALAINIEPSPAPSHDLYSP